MTTTISHKVLVLPHLIKHIPKSPSLAEDTIVYAFDLDHTLIQPKSGNRFSRSADDWTFMSYGKKPDSEKSGDLDTYSNKSTLDVLVSIVKDNAKAQIVIFSNQGGVVTVPPTSKSCLKYTAKVDQILKEILLKDTSNDRISDRVWIYASTKKPASLFGKKSKTQGRISKSSLAKTQPNEAAINPEVFDRMRKPNIGMYEELCKDFSTSFSMKYYCGDAAGRQHDFSDSDKIFAQNLGVKFTLPQDVFT